MGFIKRTLTLPTKYYHPDILGSAIMLTDYKGKVKQAYAYDAFGNIYEGPGHHSDDGQGWGDWDDEHGVNVYGYNGKRYDSAVGLYNYGFRDYSPMLGRWTSLDPIRPGVNWYEYVNNSPTNFIDPFGLLLNIPGVGKPAKPKNPD